MYSVVFCFSAHDWSLFVAANLFPDNSGEILYDPNVKRNIAFDKWQLNKVHIIVIVVL